jgi:hypothetical protein
MLSNKTSRSPSISSLLSIEHGNHINENENVDPPDPEIIHDENINDDSNYSYRVTMGHPQGAAMIKIIEDLTNLARKNNIKTMATNVQDFCTSFHNSIRLERAKTNNAIRQCN